MKRVMIGSGLGNQMFQYAFAKGLESRGQNVICDIGLLCDRQIHNGEQIQNIFVNVDVVSTKLYPLIARILYYIKYSSISTLIEKLLSCISWDLVEDEQALLNSKERNQIILGYWQSPKFFSPSFCFIFKEDLLSVQTKLFRDEMYKWIGQSVAVHVRRGDYMNYSNIYGGICTIEYYEKAIKYICSRTDTPIFVVFSDDLGWVRENIAFPKNSDVHYIDFNRGKDSWQDMYLMSRCQHNIIANSTFSWWGAWLNENPNKIVVCPEKMTNRGDSPEIFPKEWVNVSGK